MFGFLFQGDKGQPGLPGDQGGKGRKVLWFVSVGKLICVIAQINLYIYICICCFTGFQGFTWSDWESRLNWRKG